MNDMGDDLRELLRRKADQVPPHRAAPRSLMRRARRRIAVNALGAGLLVVVLAGGAFAGLRALAMRLVQRPVGPPPTSAPAPSLTPAPSHAPTSSAPPTSPASTIASCTSAQLRAMGSMDGAAGSREGALSLTNFSDV